MSNRYKPVDDYCHTDYPQVLSGLWKENWYFNFIDLPNKAWGMHHISLERKTGRGRFRALHIIDHDASYYENEIDVADRCECLSDGNLTVEVIEPFKTHTVEFDGQGYKLALKFNARFAVRDYEGREKDRNKEKVAVEHYEQGMMVSGFIEKSNESRILSCYGHRDHSWGYRDESNIKGWRWVAINFDSYNMSFVKVWITEDLSIDAGFITNNEMSTAIKKVDILSTKYDERGVPIGSEYALNDSEGRRFVLTSQRFSTTEIPMKEKKGGVVHENFSYFFNKGESTAGTGVDEYMGESKTS